MAMHVEQIELAPGLRISRVLAGLWQIADLERDGTIVDVQAAAKDMTSYSQAGFTSFDMADHYGSAEVIAGNFAKENKGTTVQLLTKWVPTPGPVTKDDVRTAVQRALDRLQVKQIDLMQFHAWNYADARWLDCLYYLQELKEEGLIRHLGLTNFDTAHLKIVLTSGIKVVSNQVCYSLLDQRAAGAMTDVCVQNDVKLLAFGTIAGGFLTDKWLHQPEPTTEQLATWSQMKYKRFIDAAGGWVRLQGVLELLDSIARKNQVSISNLASRYILQQPAVASVIIGARLGKSEHISENQKLFDFSLRSESLGFIRDALSLFDAIPGDCGDEYRKPPFLTASGDLSHHIESMPAPYPIRKGPDGRLKALSGTMWEDMAGFSRAVRKGDRIFISGTTATHGVKVIGAKDPAAQTHFILDKIEGALLSLGGRLEDVIRTRIYVRHVSDWEVIARVHGDRFRDIQPANTMVGAELIGDEYLVEIEAEAVVNRKD